MPSLDPRCASSTETPLVYLDLEILRVSTSTFRCEAKRKEILPIHFKIRSTMAPSRSRSSWLTTAFAVLTILSISAPAHALYFYMEGRQPKCFFEELPKDTLVVGTSHLYLK